MNWERPRFWVGSLAWCLMADAVYLIAVSEDVRALPRAIGAVNKRYSRMRKFCKGETRAITAGFH
jgi:hypothetical protein